MPKYTLQKIRTLPTELQDHLYDPDLNDLYSTRIFEGFTDDQVDLIHDAILDVYFLVTTPTVFLSVLKSTIKDELKYKDASEKILGLDFLPIAEYLKTDIAKLMLDNGFDPNKYKNEAKIVDIITAIRSKISFKPKDETQSHRVDGAIESLLRDVRKNEQALELLTRFVKSGGAEMSQAEAEKLISAVDTEKAVLQERGVKLVEQLPVVEKKLEPAAVATSQSAPAAATVESVTTAMGLPRQATGLARNDSTNESEALDLAAAKRKINEKITPAQAAPAATLDQLVDRAVVVCGSVCENADMQRRFRMMVALYFRDLRDELETRSKLTMPAASGGMGLSEAESESVMKLLKSKVGEFREMLQGRAEEEKRSFVAIESKRSQEEEVLRAAREKESLDKKFAELAFKRGGKMAAKAAASAVAPAIPQPGTLGTATAGSGAPVLGMAIPGASTPVVDSKQAVPSATETPKAPSITTVIRVQPAEKVELPPSVAAALFPDEPSAVIGEQIKKEATPDFIEDMAKEAGEQKTEATPQPAAPVVTAAPIEPPVPSAPPLPVVSGERPVMADVKYVPKVMGPTEYLKSLTLKEFRQLSKDPREATLRVKDKIDLLEEKSFETKTLGIQAWQASEVNATYLEILRASLEGKPVLAVIADREEKKLVNLSKDEFDAIMELNRKLRFG